MTREEIIKNPQHHSWVRAVKKKFPFIKNVEIGDNFERDFDEYNLLYMVKATIDNSKIMEMFPNWEMNYWLTDIFKNEGRLENTGLWDVYSTNDDFNAFNLRSEVQNFANEFSNRFRGLDDIPQEFKLEREPYIENFIIES